MSSTAATEERLLEAIGDPSRRMVLDLLLANGRVTPTALAADLPFTRQAVAKHLAVLTDVGLVKGVRQGREIRYSVRPEHLEAAARAMAKVAARWDARLETIKRMAEVSEAGRRKPGIRHNRPGSG